ncbi:PAAR domain-containing protein [Pseudomonas sp. GD03944]|uniref:PAAR domain-containing protein n=1 Tax=Pseudomonas sp. GD03944 TaxID=2975409 RepID=UPI00244D795C|nr:PAAR domain-containing protein [Pseudomonas sp. GD03944]MDH1263871.1 PAAR domain-containing protein [Pseudomonas sp. GD03944]
MSGKPAARLGDPTSCPIPGHGTNPIAVGSPNVLFDGLPAARMGDPSGCGGAMASAVIPTVLINGQPAAVLGSVGSHGNSVTAGSGTVLIGASGGGAPFVAPLPLIIAGHFDRAFTIATADGDPVQNLSYRIVSESGKEKIGATSASGVTASLSTGDRTEPLTIYVFGAP